MFVFPNDFQGDVNGSNVGVNESISRNQVLLKNFEDLKTSVTLNGVPNKSL